MNVYLGHTINFNGSPEIYYLVVYDITTLFSRGDSAETEDSMYIPLDYTA